MKSLTLHNIDEPLLALVKEKAKAQKKKSINQFLKELIEKSIGYKKSPTPPYYHDFENFCGVWTQQDREDFDNRIKDFEVIDGKDWQ